MPLPNIVFLLFPHTHLLDLSGPAQVFYEANKQGNELFHLHFASLNRSLQTQQGLMFSDLTLMEDLRLRKGDLICIPGIDFKLFCEGGMDRSIQLSKKWL